MGSFATLASGFLSTMVASSSPLITVIREETPTLAASAFSIRAAAFSGALAGAVKTTLPLLSRVRTSW